MDGWTVCNYVLRRFCFFTHWIAELFEWPRSHCWSDRAGRPTPCSAHRRRAQDSGCPWSWHSYRHLHCEDPALHTLLPAGEKRKTLCKFGWSTLTLTCATVVTYYWVSIPSEVIFYHVSQNGCRTTVNVHVWRSLKFMQWLTKKPCSIYCLCFGLGFFLQCICCYHTNSYILHANKFRTTNFILFLFFY